MKNTLKHVVWNFSPNKVRLFTGVNKFDNNKIRLVVFNFYINFPKN